MEAVLFVNAEAATPRCPSARDALRSPSRVGPAGRGSRGQRSQVALRQPLRPASLCALGV